MGMGRLLKQAAGQVLPSRVLYRGAARPPKRVALTFDDGPHGNTLGLLDALAVAGARATFFLQGAEAAQKPELVRAIHEAGHEIGNHGYAHTRASIGGHQAFVREAVDTQALLEDILGKAVPRLYRPPYGAITVPAFLALARRGFRFVFWSFDSEDSLIRDAEGLVQKVSSAPVRAGEILLFHEDYAHTLAALPSIVAGLKARGFELARISEL